MGVRFNNSLFTEYSRRLLIKWFFVEVSFMKLALIKGPINRTATIWGFFSSLLGMRESIGEGLATSKTLTNLFLGFYNTSVPKNKYKNQCWATA